LILHCAGQTAGRRVGRERSKLGIAAVELLIGGLVVVADAVIERQPAVDFPRVLDEKSEIVFAPLAVLEVRDAGRVRRAEEETGVWESDRVPTDGSRVQVGLSCLGGVEGVIAIRAAGAHAGPDVLCPLPAGTYGNYAFN